MTAAPAVLLPLPLLAVLALLWFTPAFSRPTLPFGVRIPESRTAEPVIAQQHRAYRTLLLAAGLPVAAAGAVLGLLLPHPWTVLTSVVALTGLGWLAWFRAHRAIAAAKRAGNWYAGVAQGVTVDTTLRTDPERFPWWWATPALGVVAATAVTGLVRFPDLPATLTVRYPGGGAAGRTVDTSVWTAFGPVLAQLGTTVLIVALTATVFRARPDLDPARPQTSSRRHRAHQVQMARAVLALAAAVDLSLFCTAWTLWDGTPASAALAAGAVAPPLLGALAVVVVAVRSGQGGSRIPMAAEEPTGVSARDDDRYWKAGLLYCNRNDPAVWVPKRFGVGWTINAGNPRGWLVLAAVLAGCALLKVLTHS